MKISQLILFLIVSLFGFSQVTTIVKHKSYVSTFSKDRLYPLCVEWWVTKKDLSCSNKSERLDKFSRDPKAPKITNLDRYYRNSGYDRGHVYPAHYASCDETSMKESFYFTNVMPQTPQLNRGDWKTVESLTELEVLEHDSVYVWAGGIGEIRKLGPVSVPQKCWKVIWVKRTNEYFCFMFSNSFDLSNGISDNRSSLKEIMSATGLSFKKRLVYKQR